MCMCTVMLGCNLKLQCCHSFTIRSNVFYVGNMELHEWHKQTASQLWSFRWDFQLGPAGLEQINKRPQLLYLLWKKKGVPAAGSRQRKAGKSVFCHCFQRRSFCLWCDAKKSLPWCASSTPSSDVCLNWDEKQKKSPILQNPFGVVTQPWAQCLEVAAGFLECVKI